MKHTEKHTNRQLQTDRQTDIQTDGQLLLTPLYKLSFLGKNRLTNRRKNRKTNRQTDSFATLLSTNYHFQEKTAKPVLTGISAKLVMFTALTQRDTIVILKRVSRKISNLS